MIKLFNDQMESVNKLRRSMSVNKRVILQGETGSGKSIMAAYMIQEALKKGNRCLFIVPRKELLRQMSETFLKYNIEHGFISSGKPHNPWADVHLATVGTLVNRLELLNHNLIFEDEAHYGSNQRDQINKKATEIGSWIVGLTATPDNPNLYKWYDDIVCGKTITELIALKRLSDFKYFAPSNPDLGGVGSLAGEYKKGELNSFMMEKSFLVGDAISHYKKFANGKLNMTFTTSIEASKRAAFDFNSNGVPSAHMDGDTPETLRKEIARDFANRKILNLCTVDLCLFGYDLSSASGVDGVAVESMSDLRPSKSKNVQRQKIGRVLRYKASPALIFDHSSNYLHHGLPDETIKWQIKQPKTKKTTEPAPPTRQCDSCFAVHPPKPACPYCGHVYKIQSRVIKEVEGELEEIEKERQRKQERQNQGRAQTLEDLIKLGKQRKMKYPRQWAQHVLNGRKRK